MGLGERIVEHFTLAGARAAARAEGEDARAARRTLLRRARQKLRAAAVLRAADLPGEALVAARAAGALLDRARASATASALVGTAGKGGALRQVGGRPARPHAGHGNAENGDVGYGGAGDGAAGDGAAWDGAARGAGAPLPEELSTADREELSRLLAEGARALDALEPFTLSLSALRARLGLRYAVPLAVLLVALAAVRVALRPRARLRAAATAQYGSVYGPENVVDGDRGSEWLLPDGQTGYVDVFLGAPRDVKAVSILNGHNAGFRDRATRDFVVELYREGRKLAEATGSFARLDASAEFVDVPVSARGADRVRLVVRSFHQRGASVAEIRVR